MWIEDPDGTRIALVEVPADHPLCREPGSGVADGQLGLQGGRVGADPFLGEQAVGDPVELVADVLDGAAGGGQAQEFPLVGAAEGQPEGYLVARGNDVAM